MSRIISICTAILLVLGASTIAAASDADTCADMSGDAGIAFCTKAIASGRNKGRDLAFLYNNRGTIQLAKHNYDKAIADFTEALAIQKFGVAWSNRALAYYKKGDYDRSIEDYSLTIANYPKDAVALVKRADVYAAKNDIDRAISDYNEASRVDPRNLDAILGVGDVLRGASRFTECADAYSRGINLLSNPGKDNSNLFYFRGICYDKSNNWEKAEPDLKRALELFPDRPAVLNYFGYSLIERGLNLDQGVRMIKRALELQPENGDVVDSLGWAYYKTGQYDAAFTQLARAATLLPNDAEVADHFGNVLAKLGRKDDAETQWKRAIKLDPKPDLLKSIEAKLRSGIPAESSEIAQASPSAIAALKAAGKISATPKDGPTVTVSAGHSGNVASVAFAPNGLWIASASDDRTVKLWEASSGRLLRTLVDFSRDHPSRQSVSISPDSRLVVLKSYGSGVTVWDAASGKIVREIEGHSVATGAFLTHDNRSVVGVMDDEIQRWDIATGVVKQRFAPLLSTDLPNILCFAVSADDQHAALGSTIRNDQSEQINIVDLTTGKSETVIRKAHKEAIEAISWSPDGQRLASASVDKTVKIWNAASGRLLQTLNAPDRVYHVVFSPDGRSIASSTFQVIQVWDAANGRLMRTIPIAALSSIAFAPDSQTIAVGAHNGNVTQWSALTGQNLIPGTAKNSGGGTSVTALSASEWLVLGSDGLNVWDAVNGQILRPIDRKAGDLYSHFWLGQNEEGGKFVVSKDRSRPEQVGWDIFKIWNAEKGKLVQSLVSDASRKVLFFSDVAISANGKWAAGLAKERSSDSSAFIEVWDVGSGRLVYSLPTEIAYPDSSNLMFSPDGASLFAFGATSASKNFSWNWSLSTGKLIKTQPFSEDFWAPAIIAPDGKTFVATEREDAGKLTIVKMWDVETSRVRRLKSSTDGALRDAAYSPDGKSVVIGTSADSDLSIYDVATGNLIQTLSDNPGSVKSISYSPDGRRVMAGNSNGTTALWDVASGTLLLTTVHAASGQWLSITPEGFFASSEHGAELVHIVRGFETTGIEQLYQALYRPDLVREKLAGDPRGLVQQAAANLNLSKVIASGNAPDVKVTLPARGLARVADSQAAVDAEISDRGGGIGRVEWRVNGVTAGIDDPAQATGGQPIRLTRSLALAPGDNTVEVVAYNSANLIASVPGRITVVSQAPAPATGPSTAAPAPGAALAANARLFVLAAGSDDYADERLKLQYSVPDAKAMAQALADAGKGLYADVETKVLSNAEVTAAGLDAAFQEMSKKVLPGDVFVLYLAGHGKTVDGRYYFVPQNFKLKGDFTDAAIDPAVRAQGIAQEQWQRWFASIPARKSVILFDTCESGTLTGDAGETKSLEQGAANDRLAQATGRSIITASSGSTAALEGYHGHGLFTYNLLDALNRGDSDNNGTIEVSELAAFVYAQVTAISERVFKQRQEPQMKITLNYPLTKQTHFLQDEVPLAMTKPDYQLTQAASLQIKPGSDATVVRGLSPKTAVTVLESRNGWSLIASEGKPLGYVATRDLAPVQ